MWKPETTPAQRDIRRWILWHQEQLDRMMCQTWDNAENDALWAEWMHYHTRQIRRLRSWLTV